MGKIENWSRVHTDEVGEIEYNWEHDRDPGLEIGVLSDDGYYAVTVLNQAEGLVNGTFITIAEDISNKEKARKKAVSWMKNHPLTDDSPENWTRSIGDEVGNKGVSRFYRLRNRRGTVKVIVHRTPTSEWAVYTPDTGLSRPDPKFSTEQAALDYAQDWMEEHPYTEMFD